MEVDRCPSFSPLVGSSAGASFSLRGVAKRCSSGLWDRFEGEGRPPLGELEMVEGEVKRPKMGDEP